jgi:UDP-N-acetylglucosamine--N-acetylmuramyl-(pentapeptide) pyrophosphoryl-undecaprenol N-acetylglucosamine transferase
VSDAGRTHIAWYVGDAAGARSRLDAVAPHLSGARLTALSVGSAPRLDACDEVVELPWPTSTSDGALDDRTVQRLGTWLAADRPDLLVVDGRESIAEVTRLAGLASVTIRRPHDPSDRSCPLPAVGSDGDLAPFPTALDPSSTPRRLHDRTAYTGLLSRYARRRPDRRAGRRSLGLAADGRVVTVVSGRDGLGDATDLAAAAAATPGWTWVTVGRCGAPADGVPPNLQRLGWTDDPWAALEAADVVVGGAALSVVAEVASAARPLVVLPRPDRPADAVVVRRLAAARAAIPLGAWPDAGVWPGLLEAACESDPAPLARMEDGGAPARAGEWLLSLARSVRRVSPARSGPRWYGTSHPARRPAPLAPVIDLTRPPVAARAGDR